MRRKQRVPDIHFYEWSVIRWLGSDTRAMLDPAGRGIFRELLDLCYTQGSIPRDMDLMARKADCTIDQLNRVWPVIRKHFCADKKDNQILINHFATTYRRAYFSYISQQKCNRKSKSAPKVIQNSSEINEMYDGGSRQEEKRREDNIREEKRREDSTVVRNVARPSFGPDFHARYEALYASHPATGYKAEGLVRYLEILSSSVNPETAASAIDREHAAWVEFWQTNPTEFRPGIGKYFEDCYYLRKPSGRREPQRKLSPLEQLQQKAQNETRN